MMENNQAIQVDSRLLPDPDSAVEEYEALGGHLTTFNCFGEDPLINSPALVARRKAEFLNCFPDFSKIFHNVVNGDFYLFREGILFLIGISKQLENNL